MTSFSRELHAELAAIGVRARRIGDRPETWRLGSLILSVDRERDRATLSYAGQSVARGLRCDATAVVAGYRRATERLAAGSLAPDAMFDALASAYRQTLASRGAPAGARVPLVEVGAALTASRGRGYTRAQLAHDLARLRREGPLCRDGLRIDLGVATGSAATRKSEVLWIEEGSSGQYFATMRMLAAGPKE